MPIPFLNSIKLNKNQVEDFCVFNYSGDPTLSSGADFGYLWLNTSATPKVLKFWDGTNYRTLIDSTTISSSTAGTANDLSGGVAGSLPYQQGVGDTTFLGIGSSGYILTSTGSAPQWSASIPSSSVSGLAASATTDTTNASNISSGTLGLARLSLASGQFYVGDGSNNPAATAKSSIPLSGFGNAAADINIGGFKITNSGTIGSGDADSTVATKGYVDSVAQGLDVKASCLVATTSDITLASPGAVTIDGVYSATDFTAGTTRILVKDQSAAAENGIYIWQGPSSAMTRSADANTWDELVGAFTFIERGTANADSGWVCTVNAGGTLGSTAVTWVKFSQAGSYTAGNGIVQSGTSFNFAQSAAYTAGQIPFAGGTLGTSSTTIGFDSNFVWDDQANRLGIGTATPSVPLSVFSSDSTLCSFVRDLTTDAGVSIQADNGGAIFDTVGVHALRLFTNATERLRIASDGVCTWSNVGGVAGTAMTLNGTGLGVGVVPSVGKLEVNLENGASNSAYFRTTTYTNLRIVGANGAATAGGSQAFFTTTGNRDWVIGQRTDTVYATANAFFIRDESASATRLSISTAGVFTFNGSITCSGNITSGYGTFAAPGFVVGDTQYGLYVDSGNLIYKSGATGLNVWKNTANTVNTMTVDNNGNLVAQGVVTAGSIVRIGTAYTGNNGWINGYFGANILWDGTNWQNYGFGGNNGWAAMVTTGTGGEFQWISAAGTGTSNRTYSETQFLAQKKMTLTGGGVLLLGTASVASSETLRVYNATNSRIIVDQASNGLVLGADASGAFFDTTGSNRLAFFVGGTQRLSIKTTGQVNFVGQASDPAGAAGDVVYNSTSNRLKYHNGTAWVDSGTRKVSVVGGAGTGTYIDATHNFNTKTVSVTVLRTTDNVVVYTDVAMTNDNTVRVTFASSVTLADYTVTVIG